MFTLKFRNVKQNREVVVAAQSYQKNKLESGSVSITVHKSTVLTDGVDYQISGGHPQGFDVCFIENLAGKTIDCVRAPDSAQPRAMRAKMVIRSIQQSEGCETLDLGAVCKNEGYDENGLDENNTFSKFTPAADLSMTITNPELLGEYNQGQEFYVDFLPVK